MNGITFRVSYYLVFVLALVLVSGWLVLAFQSPAPEVQKITIDRLWTALSYVLAFLTGGITFAHGTRARFLERIPPRSGGHHPAGNGRRHGRRPSTKPAASK
jgi:hypothetical protein